MSGKRGRPSSATWETVVVEARDGSRVGWSDGVFTGDAWFTPIARTIADSHIEIGLPHGGGVVADSANPVGAAVSMFAAFTWDCVLVSDSPLVRRVMDGGEDVAVVLGDGFGEGDGFDGDVRDYLFGVVRVQLRDSGVSGVVSKEPAVGAEGRGSFLMVDDDTVEAAVFAGLLDSSDVVGLRRVSF